MKRPFSSNTMRSVTSFFKFISSVTRCSMSTWMCSPQEAFTWRSNSVQGLTRGFSGPLWARKRITDILSKLTLSMSLR